MIEELRQSRNNTTIDITTSTATASTRHSINQIHTDLTQLRFANTIKINCAKADLQTLQLTTDQLIIQRDIIKEELTTMKEAIIAEIC